MEQYNQDTAERLGVSATFVQDNHSLSREAFTLRGLHFQTPPHGQDKLVWCISGRIFDVVVDIRSGSPTYGEAVGTELSAQNGRQLFVPIGFAHGFLTLEPDCEVMYKCSSNYAPANYGGIAWTSAKITWPLPANVAPKLNPRDEGLPALDTFSSPFSYDGNPLRALF